MAEAPGGISDGKSKPVPEVIPNTVRKRDPGNTMTLTMDPHYENRMMALETPTSAETQMKFEVIGSPGATVAKNIQNNYFQTGSQLEEIKDPAGTTAVHAACGVVEPYTVSVLKVLQDNDCSMSLLDSHARTVLHVAIDSDDDAVEQVLDFLFDSRLEVNSVDAEGNTPLHIACGSRKVNVRRSAFEP